MRRSRFAIIGLFILITGLGLAASWMVQDIASKIERSSHSLVQGAMSDIRGLEAFRAALLEHELLAHRAYGAIQPDTLSDRRRQAQAEVAEDWSKLGEWGLNPEERDRLDEHWSAIRAKTDQLYDNLRGSETDWDAAREQLAAMTEHRRQMVPVLADLADRLEQRAGVASAENRDNLALMSYLIWIYTAAILAIALGVGWAIARLFRLNRENRALAEFPERNPDPVFRLERDGSVAYANPGAAAMAHRLLGRGEADAVLDAEICGIILGQRRGEHEVEKGGYVIHFAWDWLADLGAYHVYVRDITDQRRAEQRLARMAYEDTVTGLPNRDGLMATLAAGCEQNRPAVVMVSPDRFGLMVVQNGFEAGDALLAEVGGALQSAAAEQLGTEAVVGRLDGGLFGVVIPAALELEREQVVALLAALPREVRTEHAFFQTEYRAGLRQPDPPGQSPDPAELLRDANTALMAAQRDEAARVACHDATLQQTEDHGARVEAGLHDALRRERGLRIHIQPKLHLGGETVAGGEVLIRWQDPELGSVSPGTFIPVAEQSGLIQELGQWILDRTVACLAAWQSDPRTRGAQVAINVAAPELHDPAWAEGVLQRLAERDLPGSLLEVEVTERVLAGTGDTPAVANLRRLREAGVSVAVDDFGTGYSSLAYIHRLPIDRVKIDKQFVDPLPVAASTISLAHVVVEMAEGLGLETIAEGVEHREQADALRAMGAHHVQGFLFARPMPVADFPAWCGSRTSSPTI